MLNFTKYKGNYMVLPGGIVIAIYDKNYDKAEHQEMINMMKVMKNVKLHIFVSTEDYGIGGSFMEWLADIADAVGSSGIRKIIIHSGRKLSVFKTIMTDFKIVQMDDRFAFKFRQSKYRNVWVISINNNVKLYTSPHTIPADTNTFPVQF